MRCLRIIAVAASALLPPQALGARAGDGTGTPATVEDLSWMAGCWIEERTGEYLEETWSDAEGDALLGMFRWARKGKVWLYELMSIEEDDGTLVFRLRHFSRNLEPWASEKDGPLTYPLQSLGDDEVIFENPDRDDPRRFVYRLEDDQLLVQLVGAEGRIREFRYDRLR